MFEEEKKQRIAHCVMCDDWCVQTRFIDTGERERPQGTSIFTVRLCGLLVFMSEFSRERALCSPKFQRFLL